MTVVHVSKRKFPSTSLNDKYESLKKIERGQSFIVKSKKSHLAKTTVSYWLKNKSKLFQAVEENNLSKKLKIIKIATDDNMDSVKK